jgi:hypothetical protein
MFRFFGSCIAVAAVASYGCLDCKNGGNELLCGAEGTPAPEPSPVLPSACQPRAVMPQFFALVDDPAKPLDGLKQAVAVLATPVCLVPADRSCTSDDQCLVGHCTGIDSSGKGLCPCQTAYSPLTDVLGVTLRGMATIATDTTERDPLTGKLLCLTPSQAQDLPVAQRNRMCELRRMLDVLLVENGGSNLLNDPGVKRVLLSLLDYVQGKTDGLKHYDLFSGIGRMAASQTSACDPAQGWKLIDNLLGYLTPAVAAQQLGAVQVLLADPYTKQFLAQLTGSGGAQGRDSMIVLLHSVMPSLVFARSGADALAAIGSLLNQLVYSSSSVPQSFKDEVKTVMNGVSAMLADQTGIFPPLAGVLHCVASAPVRCADPSQCTCQDDARLGCLGTDHHDELVGALYDILSRPEAQGGVDLATLVGALKTLVSIDSTGQITRALRLIVEGIQGSPDPTDPHEARDAVAALTRDAFTADEGAKLVPALSILIQNQVVLELFSLLQDLLYTCKPPHS